MRRGFSPRVRKYKLQILAPRAKSRTPYCTGTVLGLGLGLGLVVPAPVTYRFSTCTGKTGVGPWNLGMELASGLGGGGARGRGVSRLQITVLVYKFQGPTQIEDFGICNAGGVRSQIAKFQITFTNPKIQHRTRNLGSLISGSVKIQIPNSL